MGSECEDQMLNMMSCSLNSCICFSTMESCTIPTTLGLLTVSVLSLPVHQYRDLMLICEKQTQTGTKHKTKVQLIHAALHRKHINLPLQLFRSNEDVKIKIDFVAESSQHASECSLGCL